MAKVSAAKLTISIEEASQITGLSGQMFRKLIRTGQIRAARVGRRVLIPVGELERMTRAGAKLVTVRGEKSASKSA